MKLTNIYDLPKPIIQAIENEQYTGKGENKISVTGLLQPPRIRILTQRYYDQLEEDVSDRIWILLGNSIHDKLYAANVDDLAEIRLEIDVLDKILTGQFDLFSKDENELHDYKVTSVYSLNNSSRITEWQRQLNMYAYIARKHKIQVDKLSIIAVLRDWSKRHKYDAGLPDVPIVKIPIKMFSDDVVEQSIFDLVKKHSEAEDLSDDQLPYCSDDERWKSDDVYKIKKKGNKRSLRNVTTMQEAIDYGKWKDIYTDENGWKKGYSVEFIKGEYLRCNEYCSVKEYCNQYIEELEANKNE